MDAFEREAFAGLEPDQRNILWVRHQHSGQHETHFTSTYLYQIRFELLNTVLILCL
jgi:hypothetical protein